MTYDELVEELTEVIVVTDGYEGSEIDECEPACRDQAKEAIARFGTEAIINFMAVWETLQ